LAIYLPEATGVNMDNSEHDSSSIPQDTEVPHVDYAGFWIRFLASLLDSILLLLVIVPLLVMFYGPGVFFVTESPGLAYNLINYALPIIAVIIFWQYKSATPGKIMMGIYIVDAQTLKHPAFGKLVLRYFGYYLSILPLMLGFIWVAIDKRKQGFHDKIAGTLVIKMNPVDTPSAEDEPEDEPDSAPSERQDPWKE